MFLAVEAVKTYRTNPHFQLGTIQIPTWITPLVLVFFTTFLVPNTSFLGHLCGLAVGYLCLSTISLLWSLLTATRGFELLEFSQTS